MNTEVTNTEKTNVKPRKAKKVPQAPTPETQMVMPPALPSVQLVNLDMIEALPQVRTQFDEVSLAELAEDIKAHGVIQPVTLRNGSNIQYVIVAGERRVRAARLAGLTVIPAILTDMTKEQADTIQLAENIQREELSLPDLAAAIRKLYDQHKSVDTIAGMVKKSKSWVSKHLALSCEDFSWQARNLLTDGVTDDLDMLGTVSQLAKIGSYDEVAKVCTEIREGKAGRKEVRAVLKAAKDKAKAQLERQKQRIEDASSGKAPDDEQEPANRPLEFYVGQAIWQLAQTLAAPEGKTITQVADEYTPEQQAEILQRYTGWFEAGQRARTLPSAWHQLRALTAHAEQDEGMGTWEGSAFALGMYADSWTLESFLVEINETMQLIPPRKEE